MFFVNKFLFGLDFAKSGIPFGMTRIATKFDYKEMMNTNGKIRFALSSCGGKPLSNLHQSYHLFNGMQSFICVS